MKKSFLEDFEGRWERAPGNDLVHILQAVLAPSALELSDVTIVERSVYETTPVEWSGKTFQGVGATPLEAAVSLLRQIDQGRCTAWLTKDGIPGHLEFKLPEPRPKPGETYTFRRHAETAGGTRYVPGDTLTLIEMTDESPHGYRCSAGHWRIRGKTGVTVWTCFEQLVTDRYFEENVRVEASS